ncbi:hypothetical protein GCM10009846_13400 [Agrococcus versicolor]|uniref:Uncharacterized protein n=1 Tax=Agrococcus versicolor TaxID=501482 RepID=A0ABP5MET1_9MICO
MLRTRGTTVSSPQHRVGSHPSPRADREERAMDRDDDTQAGWPDEVAEAPFGRWLQLINNGGD